MKEIKQLKEIKYLDKNKSISYSYAKGYRYYYGKGDKKYHKENGDSVGTQGYYYVNNLPHNSDWDGLDMLYNYKTNILRKLYYSL